MSMTPDTARLAPHAVQRALGKAIPFRANLELNGRTLGPLEFIPIQEHEDGSASYRLHTVKYAEAVYAYSSFASDDWPEVPALEPPA